MCNWNSVHFLSSFSLDIILRLSTCPILYLTINNKVRWQILLKVNCNIFHDHELNLHSFFPFDSVFSCLKMISVITQFTESGAVMPEKAVILLLSRQQHIMMKHFHPPRNQHTVSDLFFIFFSRDLMAFGKEVHQWISFGTVYAPISFWSFFK